VEAPGVEADPVDHSGFIERYSGEGLLTEEHQIDPDGTSRVTAYTYNNQQLIRAITRIKYPAAGEEAERTEDYCTDYYRYSRSASLRTVERVYHHPEGDDEERLRLAFPHMILNAAQDAAFVSPGSAYGSDFFRDILMEEGSRVVYTLDDRGRILTETRRDEEGNLLGDLRNTWSGDRLIQVRWRSGDDDRLTEYEYDGAGDWTLEQNYRNGILERVVRQEDGREVEELYMNGRIVLRAVWENGRKISEEQVRGTGAASPQSSGGES
jgi:hypothetical protein